MGKKFAYQVIESSYPQVKVGAVLLYKQSRGPTHSEFIFNTKTGKHAGHFYMKKIGPCWVVNGKVQFEEPPAKSGVYTKGIMDAVKAKEKELLAATRPKRSKKAAPTT